MCTLALHVFQVSGVWAPFQQKGLNDSNFVTLCDKVHMEQINNSFCKYLLGVNKYTSNHAAKGELGTCSWSFMIDFTCHAVKYWLTLCKYDKNSLVYKSYLDSYQTLMDNPKSHTWFSAINNILSQFNLLKGTWVIDRIITELFTVNSCFTTY
jgi:hypothetical protein